MKLRYCVTVVTTSGRTYQTVEHTVEGAPDVAESRLREAVEEQVAKTWTDGSGLFDLGVVVGHPGAVSINRAHIEVIELIWLGTDEPPAEAGGLPADYADSAE